MFSVHHEFDMLIHRKTRFAYKKRKRGRYYSGVFFGKELAEMPVMHWNDKTKKFESVVNPRCLNYSIRNSLTNTEKRKRHSKKKALRKKVRF